MPLLALAAAPTRAAAPFPAQGTPLDRHGSKGDISRGDSGDAGPLLPDPDLPDPDLLVSIPLAPMIRRLFRRFHSDSPSIGPAVNLVGDLRQETAASLLPAPIGISGLPQATAWTVSRLERIVRRCNAQPSDGQVLLEARHARHCLASFWLGAPIDQLEALYQGPIGQVYQELLLGQLPSQPLAPDEARWKDSLARRLQEGFDGPERLNLLLALMPYCAPGRLRLDSPLSALPTWLLADYGRCFEPELIRRSDLPLALLEQTRSPLSAARASLSEALPAQSPLPSRSQLTSAPPQIPTPQSPAPQSPQPSSPPAPAPPASAPPQPPATPLPQLSDCRGNEAFAPFQDTGFRERMMGLINLFRLDPADQEVVQELQQLRRLIGQLWLDVDLSSLEALYGSPLGEVYRSLLASDFGALPLQGEEQELCQALGQVAVDQAHPAMVQAMLAVMLFFPQGRMRLGEGQSRLPLWLQEAFPLLAGLRRDP